MNKVYFYLIILSYTNRLSERGLMTETVVNGQKLANDLIREYGDTLNVPLSQVMTLFYI